METGAIEREYVVEPLETPVPDDVEPDPEFAERELVEARGDTRA